MRKGTPGFSGSRMREAREARGLSAVALSELLGVARQSVSAYEQGRATPHPEIAEQAARILNLPFVFFLQTGEFEDPNPIHWRSMAAATKTARMRSRRRYDWVRHIIAFLSAYVEFPALRLPPPLMIDDPASIGERQIEEAAEVTRRYFGLRDGAIENMTWLLENQGIIVNFAEFGAAGVDSFSQVCSDNRAYAVVNTDHGSSVRYRYDLAHELGHLILHHNQTSRDVGTGARNKAMEDQAHYFAACFLMPPHTFAKNFYAASIDGLKVMKRAWGVSMQAALKHADRLNLIDDMQTRRLWRRLSARGWRKSEPLDDRIPREKPELLRSAFRSVLDNGVLTPEKILDELPYTGQEIETLCELDPGTLVPVSAQPISSLPSVEVRTKPQKVSRRDRQSLGGEVIAFGRPDRTKT